MSIPLQNARLCLDCETIFEENECPSCASGSYMPVSRWVKPSMKAERITARKAAKKASMVLVGTGAAFVLWKLLSKGNQKADEVSEPIAETEPAVQEEKPHRSRIRRRSKSGGGEG